MLAKPDQYDSVGLWPDAAYTVLADKLFDAAVIFLLSLGDFGVLQSEKFVHH
jgi:hypothetical protein